MNNFKKRFVVSLLAFPLIYLLLYQKLLFNLLILFIFLISLTRIYNFEDYNLKFLWLILITWLTDIGGYIFGKLFGGPKLVKISPNKTWAGALGSLILSQLAFLIFFLDNSYKFNVAIIFIQIFLSIVGQIGDILMSYIKRKNNKKDTSNFIPGHGGFLDRVDGLIWIIIIGNIFI